MHRAHQTAARPAHFSFRAGRWPAIPASIARHSHRTAICASARAEWLHALVGEPRRAHPVSLAAGLAPHQHDDGDRAVATLADFSVPSGRCDAPRMRRTYSAGGARASIQQSARDIGGPRCLRARAGGRRQPLHAAQTCGACSFLLTAPNRTRESPMRGGGGRTVHRVRRAPRSSDGADSGRRRALGCSTSHFSPLLRAYAHERRVARWPCAPIKCQLGSIRASHPRHSPCGPRERGAGCLDTSDDCCGLRTAYPERAYAVAERAHRPGPGEHLLCSLIDNLGVQRHSRVRWINLTAVHSSGPRSHSTFLRALCCRSGLSL